MLTEITGRMVWEKMLSDPIAAKQMPEGPGRDAMRPFIEASPEVLAEHLEKPVTFESLINARLAFLRHCIDNGFADVMASALEADSELIKDAIQEVVDVLTEVANDVSKFFEMHGINDTVMLSRAGLNDTNKALYQAGVLTIGEVLRTQPGIILHNMR